MRFFDWSLLGFIHHYPLSIILAEFSARANLERFSQSGSSASSIFECVNRGDMRVNYSDSHFTIECWFDECWSLNTLITPFVPPISSRSSRQCALELTLIQNAGMVPLGFSRYSIDEGRSFTRILGHKNGLVSAKLRHSVVY
jgi:hypothetical protein